MTASLYRQAAGYSSGKPTLGCGPFYVYDHPEGWGIMEAKTRVIAGKAVLRCRAAGHAADNFGHRVQGISGGWGWHVVLDETWLARVVSASLAASFATQVVAHPKLLLLMRVLEHPEIEAVARLGDDHALTRAVVRLKKRGDT